MAWSVLLRLGLAAMWLVHGLEKFGVKWPVWLAGGTHSVAGMLQLMAEETPLRVVQALIQQAMLPGAALLQYPVGILELGLALALALGFLLPHAALLGAAMQAFFWLGFLTLDWPFQYPVIIGAHLVLAADSLWPPGEAQDSWVQALRLPLAALWLYQGVSASPSYLVPGLLLLTGVGSRLVGVLGLALVVPMFLRESWGAWPWSYYLVAIAHMALTMGPPARVSSLLRFMAGRRTMTDR